MGTSNLPSGKGLVFCPNEDRTVRARSVAVAFVLLASSAAAGCAMKKMPPPPPPPAYEGIVGTDTDRLQESLFKGDQAVLSNQDIDRILTARITLTDRHRLAVLRLNPRNLWFESIADLEAQNSERFLTARRSAPQLTQVRFMPRFLVPERRTIPFLREAAARFQADLLLIYGTRVRTFQRDRVIGTDEVKAESVVESVLLDVRTGIVIHTAQTAEGMWARKARGDLNFAVTVAKAEAEATGKALEKLADDVVRFFNTAEK